MKQFRLIEDLYKKRVNKDKSHQNFLLVMERMSLAQYIKYDLYDFETRGRKSYNKESLLAAILYASMNGIKSLRKMEQVFSFDVRYISILDGARPSYVTIHNFIKDNLIDEIYNIMTDMIIAFIDLNINIDLKTIYIDGTKIEAKSNKYTWVWKRASIKFRDKLFVKISKSLDELQKDILDSYDIEVKIKDTYYIEDIENITDFLDQKKADLKLKYVYGKGKRKTLFQRHHNTFDHYLYKLKDYASKIDLCGNFRNSYSKTDIDATFMRVKKDYMGNDSLLPAYNLQIGVSDFFITHLDVFQYASDSSTFIPFMEGFKSKYGYYPEYPVGDAGYGSFNNLLYLDQKGIKKYIKFPYYKKATHDKKYMNDPFAVRNYKILDNGNLLCPGNKELYFWKTSPIKGNQYGRTTELYKCDDCKRCKLREKCMKKASDLYTNKVVQLNKERTALNNEVIENLGTDHGIKLRTNRSIQVEGAFGDIKNNYGYKRCRRTSFEKVKFEMIFEAIGHNLRRYRNILNCSSEKIIHSVSEYLIEPSQLILEL